MSSDCIIRSSAGNLAGTSTTAGAKKANKSWEGSKKKNKKTEIFKKLTEIMENLFGSLCFFVFGWFLSCFLRFVLWGDTFGWGTALKCWSQGKNKWEEPKNQKSKKNKKQKKQGFQKGHQNHGKPFGESLFVCVCWVPLMLFAFLCVCGGTLLAGVKL